MDKKTRVDFKFHLPKTLQEALEMKATYGADALLYAGGTDIVPKMKALVLTPEHVISLNEIEELHHLTFEEDCVRIGAMRTLHELETHKELQKKLPLLTDSIHTMSSTQIRNTGTLVGNICNAIPSADTAPALLALNAQIKICSAAGERVIPVSELFTGVCRTSLTETEIVTEVIVPYAPKGAFASYNKESVRRALDLAIVGVAGCVVVENNVCTDCRLALGAVAVTPRRAVHAEKLLLGAALTDELIQEAAVVAATQDCSPISDIRATREYRIELVRLAVRDILMSAKNG